MYIIEKDIHQQMPASKTAKGMLANRADLEGSPFGWNKNIKKLNND